MFISYSNKLQLDGLLELIDNIITVEATCKSSKYFLNGMIDLYNLVEGITSGDTAEVRSWLSRPHTELMWMTETINKDWVKNKS